MSDMIIQNKESQKAHKDGSSASSTYLKKGLESRIAKTKITALHPNLITSKKRYKQPVYFLIKEVLSKKTI